MGFRADLDLTQILSGYDGVFGSESTAGVNYVHERSERASTELEPIPDHLYEPTPEVDGEPVKIGNGPASCSTCTALVLDPVVCWDVNGYYRSLGVHWRASRRELMRAYQAIHGERSVYLTYVLKQLLNAQVRHEYDRCRLGQQFLDDIYVQDALKRTAAREASRRTAAGDRVSAEDVLDEQGYVLRPDEMVDDVLDKRQDRKLSDPRRNLREWMWAYYLWRSFEDDADRLSRWQSLLVSALAGEGVTTHLAVGFMGKNPRPFALAAVDGNTVVLLNERETPTEELASSAAAQLMRDLQT